MAKKKVTFIPLYRLFPSVITIIALCLGVTAVRYALDGHFNIAVSLILSACFMDGIDGRVARFLNSVSEFGAHLDSLADLVSFGVAPGIVIYLWSLNQISYIGWAVILIYISCSALRLARFNVQNITTSTSNNTPHIHDIQKITHHKSSNRPLINKHKKNFFLGLPMPAAAVLSLTPMIFTFKILENSVLSPIFIAIYTLLVGWLMISKVPVFAGKYIKVAPRNIPLVLLFVWILIVSIIISPWLVLPILIFSYVSSIIIGIIYYHIMMKKLINHYNKNIEI